MSRPAQPGRMVARRAIAVALAGSLLMLVAFIFDAAPLFVPGVALLAIGAAAPGWVWTCARGAQARRVLGAERVVEEQPLEAGIEVRRGRLGLPGAEIVDPFTGSRLDLSGPLSPLRGDSQVLWGPALWAADGSGAVIPSDRGGTPRQGLAWVPADGQPVVELVAGELFGSPRWGR